MDMNKRIVTLARDILDDFRHLFSMVDSEYKGEFYVCGDVTHTTTHNLPTLESRTVTAGLDSVSLLSKTYTKLVAALCDGDLNFYLRNQVTVEEIENLVLKYT